MLIIIVTRNTLDCHQSTVYSSRVIFSSIFLQICPFVFFSLYFRSASDPVLRNKCQWWANLNRDSCMRIIDPVENWWCRMSFDDYLSNFSKLEMCMMTPVCDTLSRDDAWQAKYVWKVTVHDGSWQRQVNAGGCRNYIGIWLIIFILCDGTGDGIVRLVVSMLG